MDRKKIVLVLKDGQTISDTELEELAKNQEVTVQDIEVCYKSDIQSYELMKPIEPVIKDLTGWKAQLERQEKRFIKEQHKLAKRFYRK